MSSQISIHALLAESDFECWTVPNRLLRFLSTLSLRRATNTPIKAYNIIKISIHALLAESDQNRPRPSTGIDNFYPRSPCGERQSCHRLTHHQSVFLSTLSLRRATSLTTYLDTSSMISIHALLAESDDNTHTYRVYCPEFLSTLSLRRATVTVLGIQHRVGISIHALLAESDQLYIDRTAETVIFLSTLSLRRATLYWRIVKST